MDTEDYVSFETAKLLKEKGFNWNTDKQFNSDKIVGDYNITDRSRYPERYLDAPTLQMVMKWLRENYCLYIDIELLSGPSFSWYIWFMNDPKHMMGCSEDIRHYYDAYEEACEAAIKYCLENLI